LVAGLAATYTEHGSITSENGAPFSGEISVKPELLQQVIPSDMATMQPNVR